MKYSKGNIIRFTPDSGWTITFRAYDEDRKPTGEAWVEEFIGWAVVSDGESDEGHETDLVPVILEEGHPVQLGWYLESRTPVVRWSLTRS